jgi:hypothetical protein
LPDWRAEALDFGLAAGRLAVVRPKRAGDLFRLPVIFGWFATQAWMSACATAHR